MNASAIRSTISPGRVQFVDLSRQYAELHGELDAAVRSVFESGAFVLGDEVAAFEEEFAAYCGVRHCVGVASGLDALALGLKGLGVEAGDEVIIPANTFIATALAVSQVGAIPVLVDHDPLSYNLDPKRISAAITSRTKAIVPVHLYGRAAEMDAISVIAAEHNLVVLEDACQAHGAMYKGRRCGSLSRAAAFSFYPGKNLGGCGDGGCVTTDDDDLADWLRKARNYGSLVKYHHEFRGFNSRLDSLQAAVLRVKLRRLDPWNELRRGAAEAYCAALAGFPLVLPARGAEASHVHHVFVIRVPRKARSQGSLISPRDQLLTRMGQRGISAGIHYPVPIHRQPAYRDRCTVPAPLTHTAAFCDELLSLPMHPHLTHEEITAVVDCVRSFYSA